MTFHRVMLIKCNGEGCGQGHITDTPMQDPDAKPTTATNNAATATNQNTTATNNGNTAANASSAHNNMQPTMLMNYIIKAQGEVAADL